MDKQTLTVFITIEGMHCSSCEARLESELRNIPGVIKVEADYIASELKIIYYPDELKLSKIIDSIEAMDYRVKNTSGDFSGLKDERERGFSWRDLLGSAIIIAAAFLIINRTVGFGFLPQISQSMGYGLLFIVGLITSVHCLAMCGGINISQSVVYKIEPGGIKPLTRFKPGIQYNLGRVISYTVIGGLAGALGSVVTLSGTAKGVLAITAGLFMAIMGLNMLNIFPWLRRLNPRLPKVLSRLNNKGRKRRGPIYVGLLNGLMPCGPLQAMQLYALGTGSVMAGALSMLVFSLGTIPLMFGLGALSSFLNSRFKHQMLQVSGVLVIVLGIIMLSRGMNLSGINLAYAAPLSPGPGNVARLDGKVQTVNTTIEAGRYKPVFVQKGIPVRWTISAAAEDLNGCNNPVTVPKYNIQKKLVPGDNLIEFIPQEEGTITYTCWMGMISSTITVVSDISKISSQELQSVNAAETAGSAGRAGCCPGQGANPALSGAALPECCKAAATANINAVSGANCCQ